MQSLGFVIDKEGKITYFGKWVALSNIDAYDKRQNHTSSFETEIEPTEYFKSLNLIYEKIGDYWIHSVAFDLSLQGVIIMLNIGSYKENEEMNLYVPTDLTDLQKEILTELYPILKAFENVNIRTSSSNVMHKNYTYTSIDDYFEDYGIDLLKR